MRLAYVFFNGDLLGKKEYYLNLLKSEQGDIFCADGGANLLEELNLTPKELWGDLDSISQNLLNKYVENGVIIKKFPKDKDFTDGELILQHLSDKNYDKIIIIGGLGGRRDHELTNLTLAFKFKNLKFLTEREEIFAIDKNLYLKEIEGKTFSLIPFSEKITDLTLKGFKYPLENYTLHQGDSICMSNVVINKVAKISFKEGKLLGILIK